MSFYMYKKSLTHHHHSRPPSVHQALPYQVGREQLVTLTELLERDTTREALAADTCALQHSVASQLLQDQRRHDLAGLSGQEYTGGRGHTNR